MDAEILIIGAGAAGISAATKLLENGFSNVKILEAENRIGGRIHSVYLGNAYVDLGAEEVHGEQGNIIVELAEDYLKNKTPLTRSSCYYSDGTKIPQELANEILGFIEDFCENDGGVQDSIGKVFIDRLDTIIMEKHKEDLKTLKKIKEFLPLCESFFLILEGPFSWFDVVTESTSHFIDCEGDQFIGWNGLGCQTILNLLMKKIPNEEKQVLFEHHILLNKIVKEIHWNLSDKVKLVCEDGCIYNADHVIFTPSVGVLRTKHMDLFKPHLPLGKIDILSKIGFSNVMKVALKFSKKWWHGTPFGFVWSDEQKESLQKQHEGDIQQGDKSWFTAVNWLMEAPDNDQVLVAWLTGPVTSRIERLSDNEIKDGIIHVLKKFLHKDFDIPEPEEIIPTRWNSNPNFCGTYSYETVEASKMELPFQEILQEPLLSEGVPRVLFAGEATHITEYSTVNGAILSGYREADRLISMYKESM